MYWYFDGIGWNRSTDKVPPLPFTDAHPMTRKERQALRLSNFNRMKQLTKLIPEDAPHDTTMQLLVSQNINLLSPQETTPLSPLQVMKTTQDKIVVKTDTNQLVLLLFHNTIHYITRPLKARV
jgi:hypothetical protein